MEPNTFFNLSFDYTWRLVEKRKLKQFIDEKIRISNLSTRDSDAHTTINANYKNIEGNDDKLVKKFLKENQQ